VTGPEHYREAERLAELATKSGDREFHAALAQVHATLADAATQVDGAAVMRPADRHEWLKAIDPEYAAEHTWHGNCAIGAPCRGSL
jgi:hypothetical protein